MLSRRLLSISLAVVVGVFASAIATSAMSPSDELLFNRAVAAVETIIDEANLFAERGIEVIEHVTTIEQFVTAVRRTNARVGEYIQAAQSLIARINARFGVCLVLVHVDVVVYNAHLGLQAIVDPIHLTSSGS